MAVETQAVDKESRAELEAVRKGKTRRFVMLTKGTSILSLIVYKKGNIDKYKKQAKEAGTGQLCFGIVEGPAPDLKFKLALADGFDKEPTKTAALKSFLDDNADLKCTPSFVLVEVLPAILDDDDAAAQPTPSPSAAAAATAPSASAAATAAPAADAASFTARLKEIKPQLADLLDDGTPDAAKAKGLSDQLAPLVKEKNFAAGHQVLDQIEALLNAPPAHPSGKIPVPPPGPPPGANDRRLTASLRYLQPQLLQALRAFPEQKAAIDGLTADVERCIKEGRFDDGDQALARIDELLNSLGTVDPQKVTAFRNQWDLALDVWEAAVADVRDQLFVLKEVLVDSDDEELDEIGEFGLNAVAQDHLVPLSAALFELESTGADRLKTAAKRVQNLVRAFRTHVETSEKVLACDENPFDVPVSIRQTLAPGFTALEKELDGLLSA